MRIGAAWTYVRSELRRRWLSLLALALFVVVGTGAAVGALVLAERTDSAYPDYVRRADVNPLVVNPSLSSNAVDAAMRSLPGVASVRADDLLIGSLTAPEGGRLGDLLNDPREAWLQIRGSSDGRYADVDRPVITEGRLPSGERELFVVADYRATLEENLGRDVDLGDVIDVGFFSAKWAVTRTDALGNAEEVDFDQVVQPIGIEPLTVVGFGHMSADVLPDDLYPREQVLTSRDVADRYSCHYDVDAATTYDELTTTLVERCSTLYRYYSMGLEPGTTLDDVRTEFGGLVEELNADIAPDVAGRNIGYFPISQDRTALDETIRQTTTPVVWALNVFGVVAGLATVVIALLVVVRLVRRTDPDQRSLFALGAPALTRTAATAGGPLLSALVGLVGGVLLAAVVSLAGPIGSVRRLEPDPGAELPGRVAAPAAGILALLVVLGTVAIAYRAVRRAPRIVAARERRLPRWLASSVNNRPWAVVGLRAAFGERRDDTTGAVVAGGAVAVLVTVAAVVFGANLAAVADSPVRYGWPWQAAAVTGGGYSDAVVANVEATLGDRQEVESTDYYAFDPAARFTTTSESEGAAVPTVFGFAGSESSPFAVVDGRPTQNSREVVLGARTAEELGLALGDQVTIETFNLPEESATVRATVVGTAVLPAVGPFVADRSGLGRGAFLAVDVPADGQGGDANPAALVAVRLVDGTDPTEFVESVRPVTPEWDMSGTPPILVDHPVHPPEIVDITDMRGAPLLLAVILAVALALGLALSIAVSVRDRQRDLAVLRVLGLRGRELRSTVRWQALATIAVGLVVGLPLGIVLGRLAWRRFADQLGLVPRADIPWTWLAGVVAAAVVVGLLAALVPGRYAARVRPAAILRRQ